MSDNNVVSLDEKRAVKERNDFADAVAKNMGVSVEGLAALVDGTPEDIRESLLDCVERNIAYRAFDERKKERERGQGLDPDGCYNSVCPECVQHEIEEQNQETGAITFSGRSNFCREGRAQGCVFRLKEHPISSPFIDYLSHNECQRILQRIGYIRIEDDSEEALGTDFMMHLATRRLWQAYVLLLVETGRVTIPEEQLNRMRELGHDDGHSKFVWGQDGAHVYFKDRELPQNVATVNELIAQKNALLAFIRGELDWPHGRCPCGGDVNWNGIAHTENCRLRDKE